MKSNKEIALLQSPLQQIATTNESIMLATSEIHSVITIDLKKAADKTSAEIKRHTVILGEIRDLLKQQANQKNESVKSGGMKIPGLGAFATAAFAVVGIAAALLISAGLLSIMPVPNIAQFLTALALVALFWVIIPPFIKLTEAVQKSGMTGGIASKITGFSPAAALQVVGIAVLAMVGMAVGLVLASWVFQLMVPINLQTFVTALAIAVIFIPVSWSIGLILKALTKNKITMDAKGMKTLAMVPVAMAAIALGLVAAAYIMQLLPSKFVSPPIEWSLKVGLALFVFAGTFALLANAVKSLGPKGMLLAVFAIPIVALGLVAAAWITKLLPDEYKSPEVEWSLKVGLSLFVFSFGFIAIALASKVVGVSGMMKGLLGLVAVAIGILAVAWIFSVLPDAWISPPLDWSFNAALSLFLFSIPLAVIGGIAMLLTPVGLLLGAVGMILVAGVIWVVAWIFSKLPDVNVGAMDKLARGLMSPIHAMIDALVRFKDEIGVESMVPLAGGILAIAGAWMALSIAVAGGAVGGVIAAVGKAISGAINWIFGNEEETPFTILEGLADHAGTIRKLAGPLGQIAAAMSVKGLEPFIAAIGAAKKLSYYNLTSPASQLERIRDAFKAIGKNAGALRTAFRPLHNLMAKTDLMVNLANHLRIVADAYGEFAQSTHKTNIEAVWASVAMFNALSRLAGIANAMVMVQNAVASISSHAEEFIRALSPVSMLASIIPQMILKKSADSIRSIAMSFFSIMNTADKIGVGDVFLTSELFNQFRQLAILESPIKSIARSFVVIAKQAKGLAMAVQPLLVFMDMKHAHAMRHHSRSLENMERSYGKFTRHTNKVNIKAVNATTRMFRALTDLAEAEGDNVMKILAEELFKATKELASVVVRLEEAVDEQTAAQEGSGNIIVDTVEALKKVLQKNTEQAADNMDAMAGTQEVKVTNFHSITTALTQIEERLGLPITVQDVDDITT